jgi:hypothetical protein
MCNCNKSEICSLKLKFTNYVNDNMIKETNMALELLRNINCDNLEEVKKELTKIVGDEIIEEKVIISSVSISSSNKSIDCATSYKQCTNKCNGDVNCSKKCEDAFKICIGIK